MGNGLDFFPMDCHLNDDVAYIESRYGAKGFSIIVKLWQKVYSGEGYYCEWSEKAAVLFLGKWFTGNSGVDNNLIAEVVQTAIDEGIFDRNMFEKYNILTSRGIQKRYLQAAKRRLSVDIKKEYLLLNASELKGNVNIIEGNVYIESKNVHIERQSKVKESKGKESRVKDSKEKRENAALTLASMVEAECFSLDLKSTIKDWISYKKEKNQLYKETGFKSLLTQIKKHVDEYGEDKVIDVISLSMSNNWQGIIWDKIDRRGCSKPMQTSYDRMLNRVSEVDNWT